MEVCVVNKLLLTLPQHNSLVSNRSAKFSAK